jgi:hypothetical protein
MAEAKGFMVGGLVGLALAVLLVGASSFYGHPGAAASSGLQSTPYQVPAPTQPGTTTYTAVSTAAPQGALNSAAKVQSTQAPTPTAGAATTTTSPQVSPAPAPVSAVAPVPISSSRLSTLPAEGVGQLAVTVSPLLVGLVVAGLLYGLYTKRQDSA